MFWRRRPPNNSRKIDLFLVGYPTVLNLREWIWEVSCTPQTTEYPHVFTYSLAHFGIVSTYFDRMRLNSPRVPFLYAVLSSRTHVDIKWVSNLRLQFNQLGQEKSQRKVIHLEILNCINLFTVIERCKGDSFDNLKKISRAARHDISSLLFLSRLFTRLNHCAANWSLVLI